MRWVSASSRRGLSKVMSSRTAFVFLIGICVLVISALVSGCGGGGRISSPLVRLPSGGSLGVRSVNLNNYNNWREPNPRSADYAEKVQCLAKRDRICMTERYSYDSKLTPDRLRQLNPRARIYRVFDLICKNNWDSDWRGGAPIGDQFLQTPIPYQEIVDNDWWLRDGNGEIVKENERTWFLDVGKPGLKEMLLEKMLSRLEGKGFDGVVLDYHGADKHLYNTYATQMGPAPEAYSSEEEWFAKAVKPMLEYVINGVRSRGYELIVNCAGQHYNLDPRVQWLRGRIDGSIYEVWALQDDTDWMDPDGVELRINSFLDDPLEAWTADFGLRGPGCTTEPGPDPEYNRKFTVALAMYYISLPQSPALRAKRFYGHYKNMQVEWEPLWDFSIGDPAELPKKKSDSYFWSRRYTAGLVLLNYEAGESITFALDRSYRTPTGQVVSGSVTIGPHSAMILAVNGD